MKILQNLLDETIKSQFTLENLGCIVIERHLAALGVTLSEKQKHDLSKHLIKSATDSFSLVLGDSQVPPDFLAKRGESGSVVINFDDAESVLNDLTEQINRHLISRIPELASDIGEIVASTLMKGSRSMLRRRRSDHRKYEAYIRRYWQLALDLLETMIVISTEAGGDFNNEIRSEDRNGRENLVEAMARLHARSCQVASEVLSLLRAGHADGAHARWRCLHEIAVVLFFIARNGEDTAERYLLHDAIESYKAAHIYQKSADRLGYEPFTEVEMAEFKKNRDALITRFGSDFDEEYGWAISGTGKKRPRFIDIQESVEMGHMRHFYKMASHNVHANPKGVFLKLGVLKGGPDILLAGPSVLGLADAGQGTAISICQATAAFLTIEPNMDRLVICDVLRRFLADTEQAFLAAEADVEDTYIKGLEVEEV
jgi:Family of unknown function (DUF5677)